MPKNILTENATKKDIEEWLKTNDKKVEVDISSHVNMLDKINKVINGQIEKSKSSKDDSNNDHDDTPASNREAISKRNRIQTVEVKYNGSVSSTSWTVDFDLDKGQRIDQIGFSNLLRKIVSDHLIFDADRNIFWIYDSKRWVPLNSKGQDLRQFSRQAVNIFIQNVQCNYYYIRYDPEQGLYLLSGKPVQGKNESDKGFESRMTQYKANINKIKRYNKFIDFMQRSTVIEQAFKDLKSLMAKSNIPWDSNDFLLNVNNGVVNLRTGELMDHDKNLYLTRIAPVNYDPKAQHPILDRTLSVSFPNDEELQAYMQKEAGYFLIGGNRDEHLFLWFGPSARNGKSVLANTFGRILGSEQKDHSGYAKSVPVNTFLSPKFGDDAKTADPNLAGLQGVRLAIASEPDRNAKLASGKVKALTGDRIITARFLHQDPASFESKFKILISCNFLPSSDGDASIKRRMNIVEFSHHIKEGSLEDDPFVLDKLWNEREGILNWMIQGSVMNEKTRQQRIAKKNQLLEQDKSEGKSLEDVNESVYEDPLLPLPESVSEAIDKYIYNANSVSQFLHESVISKHDYWKYLVTNVFKKFDEGEFQSVYNKNNKDQDTSERGFDSKYLKEQKLLCLPHAYILRSDLYKLYQNYCGANGIIHPVSSHNFYDMTSRYLVPTRLHQGRVFLGVCATPAAGNEGWHDRELYKHWVDAPSDLKLRIYNAATRARLAVRSSNGEMFKGTYSLINVNDKDKTTNQQVLKLAKSIKINPDLYFGRLAGTLDNSDIDFDQEMDEIHGGLDYIDSEDKPDDDQSLKAIFG
ncbi:phage/plasmid primase, P4 family [Limosilactobacillus reuteri]